MSEKPLPLNKNISIIGCGWLGLPLAKQLVDAGYQVKGSTTSMEKIETLKSFGIDAFYVKLTEDFIKGDIAECLSDSKILIVNIPPGLRKYAETNFVQQMRCLIPYLERSSIKKVLFVSSTSVYGDDESTPTITEASIQNPESEAGKQLLKVEEMFNRNTHFQTTILRFSGLFGEDRHPAKNLSEKINIKNPDAPVNLIHLTDCIGIINAILKKDVWNDTFNASSIPHPTRQEYYTSICEKMKIPVPQFDHSTSSKGKYIDSTKLEQLLNYEFQVKIE